MSVHRLLFDTTSAATIADSANVGAYVRSSDGTLITHTNVGGKDALDVNIAGPLSIDVDLDASAGDSVEAWAHDGTGNAIGSTSGALNVSIQNASVAVTATDLDIRDLTHASDSIRLGDGTTLTTVTTVSGKNGLDVNIINDSSSPVTVNDAALANTAIEATASSVTTTAAALLASQLASRKYQRIYNNGNRNTFVGPTGVTTSSGYPLPPGSEIELRVGPAVSVFAIAAGGTQDLRNLELS